MKKLLTLTGLGALFAYFLDPRSGAGRRNTTRDRVLAFFRRGARRGEQAGRAVAAEAYGVAQKVTHLKEEPKEYDDVTLARKVESEIFRDADAPKGQVDVDVQNGIVQLRGEVHDPELIEELVAKALGVQGVKDVENLLHLPQTQAPMHQ